jgi:hypothetical protein
MPKPSGHLPAIGRVCKPTGRASSGHHEAATAAMAFPCADHPGRALRANSSSLLPGKSDSTRG